MKIDKGVSYNEYTPFRGRGVRMSSYPFMEMDIGDSILDNAPNTAASKAYQSAKKYAERSGDRKFSAKKVNGGVRIWRVS